MKTRAPRGSGATGAAKLGALRGETKEPRDTQVGNLYWCPNVRMSHPNGHCGSGTKREKQVGATRLRVKEVSLVEQDVSCGGLDLPNWVGQVIGWMRNRQSR